MREHMRRWGALYALGVWFVGSWVGQLVAQLFTARADAAAHGQPLDGGEFAAEFVASTLENWQSEALQLLAQAALLLGPWAYLLWGADRNADKRDLAAMEERLCRRIDQAVARPARQEPAG